MTLVLFQPAAFGAGVAVPQVSVGATVSMVIASEEESTDWESPDTVWRAVITWVPSSRVAAPLVVTVVVLPEATALPMATPSA